MIIAVSMRVVSHTTYPEMRDALSHDWVRILNGLGVIPVPVPNTLVNPSAYLQAIKAGGLILTGGEDIGPLPGESGDQDPPALRDRTERSLFESAVSAGLPVFGVCRGMQMINLRFGGSLSRQLSRECPPEETHTVTRHEVDIVEPTLRRLAGMERVVTNSYHAQGVTLSRLAPSLRPFALTRGGVVEGLRHPDLPIWGVQWHPERENPAAALDRVLLNEWLARCG